MHFAGKTGVFILMFKISFSGNSKAIDLVQVTSLQEFIDFTKKIPNRILSASPLFTPGQTIQKMHCILQVDRGKESEYFSSFRSVNFEFV